MSNDRTSQMGKPSSKDLNLLLNLYQNYQYIEVIENADILISHFPETALLYNIKGVAAAGLDKFSDAVKNYQKAIEYYPEYAEAYNNLGNALRNSSHLSEAILAYRKAILIDPSHAEYHNNLGVGFLDQKELLKAKSCFEKAVELNSNYINAHNNLGGVFKSLGQTQAAIDVFLRVLEIDSKNVDAGHMLNVLTNANITSIPQAYVTNLFEAYATNFDKSLVTQLNYKGPQELKKLVKKLDRNTFETTLDLGCGTGLMGALLKELSKDLTGVDLSSKMLKSATRLGIYTDLKHIDALDYLVRTEKKFDLFVAADVFIYFGDLTDIFQKMKNRSNVGSKLLFTTEYFEGQGYRLNDTGRFSHSQKYIEKLCSSMGVQIEAFKTGHLRHDAGNSVLGGFYLVHLL